MRKAQNKIKFIVFFETEYKAKTNAFKMFTDTFGKIRMTGATDLIKIIEFGYRYYFDYEEAHTNGHLDLKLGKYILKEISERKTQSREGFYVMYETNQHDYSVYVNKIEELCKTKFPLVNIAENSTLSRREETILYFHHEKMIFPFNESSIEAQIDKVKDEKNKEIEALNQKISALEEEIFMTDLILPEYIKKELVEVKERISAKQS